VAKARLRVSPEALWAFLSDTDRLNRTIGLSAVRFVPYSEPEKKGHYRAQTSFLGLTLSYEEFPFEWVEGRYYRVYRRFESGPFREITGGIALHPFPEGTELEVFATGVPRSWLWSIAARRSLEKKAARDVLELARAFERHAQDPTRQSPPGLPAPEDLHPEVLEARLASVRTGPVDRLKTHLRLGSDLEVLRMRPFDWADRWGVDRIEVLRLFLASTRAGVLDLAWSVICPTCRAASSEMLTLSQMKSQAHCDTCGIKFGADFAASVEARFSVNPAVRVARRDTYCIGGPANRTEIVAQFRLSPGEKRSEAFSLSPSSLRVRCYQAPGIVPFCGSRIRVEPDGLKLDGERSGALELSNGLDREALVVIERERWKDIAATAALVTSLQDFHDLFPGEAVAPGEEIGIASLAILFTDLKGSTELYQKLGDTKAFTFVQNHFRYLTERVAGHRGGIVKTMGDAVMATFASGRDALEAALEMQRNWEEFRRSQGDYGRVSLKIGIHQGPAIAINNAGRLDFFGTTINTAARVQSQSVGDDIVLSTALEEDPSVRPVLQSASLRREALEVSLRGLEGSHTLYRLRPES
jgi:class 3 adenylate cyclase